MINKHKSNKIKENSNTVRHLNNGTDHRHSKSCCDQSSPARRTITGHLCGIHWSPVVRVSQHYNDVIMSAMASQSTGVSIVCLTVCLGADQRKHQSSASLAFVREIHRWPVDSPHRGPVTRKMFPFDDVIRGNEMFHIVWFIDISHGIIWYKSSVRWNRVGRNFNSTLNIL